MSQRKLIREPASIFWTLHMVCRPYGFLEVFDPDYTPNTTDEGGRRYTFKEQPDIGQWNLANLANAMLIGGLMDEVILSFVQLPCFSWQYPHFYMPYYISVICHDLWELSWQAQITWLSLVSLFCFLLQSAFLITVSCLLVSVKPIAWKGHFMSAVSSTRQMKAKLWSTWSQDLQRVLDYFKCGIIISNHPGHQTSLKPW